MIVVVHSQTLLEVGAVQCSRCEKLLLYNSVKTGTSSWNNHVKTSCPALKKPSFVTAPAPAKSKFVDKMADFCAHTLSSMNHLVNEAMVELIQAAVNVGYTCARAQDGRVDARQLVPCANTLTNRHGERANEARATVMPRRCTTYMWTEDNTKMHYVDITAHFADKE